MSWPSGNNSIDDNWNYNDFTCQPVFWPNIIILLARVLVKIIQLVFWNYEVNQIIVSSCSDLIIISKRFLLWILNDSSQKIKLVFLIIQMNYFYFECQLVFWLVLIFPILSDLAKLWNTFYLSLLEKSADFISLLYQLNQLSSWIYFNLQILHT